MNQRRSYLEQRFGEIILASSSPRRAQILQQVGFRFIISPSHVDEIFPHEDPVEMAKGIASMKAAEVVGRFPDQIVLAADTIVVVDGTILGKPKDADEATAMLRSLSGKTHTVHTAFTVWKSNSGQKVTDVESTRVTFKPLSDEWIAAYVAQGTVYDKAGSYGIQDQSAVAVRSIQGDFYNVVGLPIARIVDVMERVFQ